MGYANYSEVYFAANSENGKLIKIGETTNARRRAKQLIEENYYVLKTIKVKGDDAARLFVESYLRTRIEAIGKTARIRKDYFECENENIAQWFFSQFDLWVEEANNILEQMKSGGTASISFSTSYQPTYFENHGAPWQILAYINNK